MAGTVIRTRAVRLASPAAAMRRTVVMKLLHYIKRGWGGGPLAGGGLPGPRPCGVGPPLGRWRLLPRWSPRRGLFPSRPPRRALLCPAAVWGPLLGPGPLGRRALRGRLLLSRGFLLR